LLEAVAPGVASMVATLLWGFNFIIGSMLAMVTRLTIQGLRNLKIMNRQYQNNYLLSRISGLAFDIMIVAGIASINIDDLSGMWLPFILMAVLGGIITFVYLIYMCKKIYPDYTYEGFFSMYGMLTGTISSGVLLLREIDPEYETPAANNLITGSSFGIVFGAPVLLLVSMAAKSDFMVWVVLGLIFIYLAALLAFIFLVGRKKK
jgi:ESS family glutamate:Na+ symporter